MRPRRASVRGPGGAPQAWESRRLDRRYMRPSALASPGSSLSSRRLLALATVSRSASAPGLRTKSMILCRGFTTLNGSSVAQPGPLRERRLDVLDVVHSARVVPAARVPGADAAPEDVRPA